MEEQNSRTPITKIWSTLLNKYVEHQIAVPFCNYQADTAGSLKQRRGLLADTS